MPLQVKDESHVAKHETAQECSKIFKKLLDKTKAEKEKHALWRQVEDPIMFSHDNATFFTAAELPDEGLGEVWCVVNMPPKSPDLHKIVEHPIHPIKALFRKRFTQLAGKVKHDKAMDLLEDCVKEAVKTRSIAADVLTMPSTLRSVIKNGGDWADTPWR